VQSIFVHGGSVFAGGLFNSIGGQSRPGMAAVDPAIGLATSWVPAANAAMYAAAAKGSLLYTGGGFTTINGQARTYLAVWDDGSTNVSHAGPPSSTTAWVTGSDPCIHISNLDPNACSLTVLDMMGRTLLHGPPKMAIDATALAAGHYALILRDQQGAIITRIPLLMW
jgi:hypothetical protein